MQKSWADDHQDWTVENWRAVCFSDEANWI